MKKINKINKLARHIIKRGFGSVSLQEDAKNRLKLQILIHRNVKTMTSDLNKM